LEFILFLIQNMLRLGQSVNNKSLLINLAP
jgi:hypothetical protein